MLNPLQSSTSVFFRPGTFFRCYALTKLASIFRSSRIWNSGIRHSADLTLLCAGSGQSGPTFGQNSGVNPAIHFAPQCPVLALRMSWLCLGEATTFSSVGLVREPTLV
jgi:hypothetical protein